MKTFRVTVNLILLLSTTILLILIGNHKFVNTSNETIINVFLQIMHVSLLGSTILYGVKQVKNKKWAELCLTLLPVILFIGAIVFMLLKIQIPSIALLVFDFYIIYFFSFLLYRDLKVTK